MLVVYETCTPWVVTRTTSTGVPAGAVAEPVQLKERGTEPPGVMVVVVVVVPDDKVYVTVPVLHNIVPLVNSSSPRVIEVEGLSGGL